MFYRIGTLGDYMSYGADVLTCTSNNTASGEAHEKDQGENKREEALHDGWFIGVNFLSVDSGGNESGAWC